MKRFIEFGPFRIDTLRRLLLREGQLLPLPARAFDMLLALIESGGNIITKDELMRRVWPDTIVGENNLTIAISGLRKTLGEGHNDRKYIVTIPGMGYSFVASVSELSPDQANNGASPEESRRNMPQPKAEAGNNSIRSIAVLPFKSLTKQDFDPYLGPGLADAVITRLGNLRQLVVCPTSTVLRYASPRQDPIAAGRALAVDSVLDAHFQRLEDRIRLTVQFVRVRDGHQLWAETFDEMFTNLFSVQDTVSEHVAQALMLKLNDQEKKQLSKRDTVNSEAYQSYLYGRYFWNKRTPDGLKRAIEYFQKALAQDPSYAVSYAGLADCYNLLGYYGLQPPGESFPKAKEAGLQALRLDDSLAEAHASMALFNSVYQWDWATAEREYKRAIEINNNYPTAHQWYAECLSAMGRDAEAQAEVKRALDLDPLSLSANAASGLILYFGNRYAQAVAQLEKTLELDANFLPARWFLAWTLVAMRRYQDALAQLEEAEALSPDNARTLGELGFVQAARGNRSTVQRILVQLRELSRRTYVSSFSLAIIAAASDQKDEAFDALNRACEERNWNVSYLNRDPKLDSLRSDPRFAALARKIGLYKQ
jgi:DNA-binding winged helix-turn-helix (wHTH) protein/tetratricopeptide (TPR) repeat protein